MEINSQLTSLNKVGEHVLDGTVLHWVELCMHVARPAHLVPFSPLVIPAVQNTLTHFQVSPDSSVTTVQNFSKHHNFIGEETLWLERLCDLLKGNRQPTSVKVSCMRTEISP